MKMVKCCKCGNGFEMPDNYFGNILCEACDPFMQDPEPIVMNRACPRNCPGTIQSPSLDAGDDGLKRRPFPSTECVPGCKNFAGGEVKHHKDCPYYNTNLVETMIKLNPYPETVFTEPTKEEYGLMKMAFKEYGLIPDKFFGSWGRQVWKNCVNDLKDILDPED